MNSFLVRQIIKKELQNDYYEYAGALPSSGGNGDGTWHRDIYSLFENDEFDIAMPNFYFTMLIPLVNITDEDGPTEVIVGSHKTAYHKTGVPKNPEKIRCTDLNPGDVVLMNGKAVHRGSANNGLRERDYLYIVFQKKWCAGGKGGR
jgi:ectoine hydroxylase-related dioxygenase (phytanoyl-CoA dioxygenase family)